MIRWTRRRFLGATAAVCAGCSGSDESRGDEAVPTSVTRDPPPSAPLAAPLSSPVTDAVDRVADADRPVGAFGAGVAVGPISEVIATVEADGATYVPEARTWLARYPKAALPDALDVYDDALREGLELGLVALYQKCPHLGCRVPYCASPGWFECGCHGSMYTAVGEHRGGPGPRGWTCSRSSSRTVSS